MGTTTNNLFPYPESTDFVADGATAIENLADAIDPVVGNVTSLVRRTGDLWPSGVLSTVLFGAGDVLVDTSDWHSTVTNPGRITPTIKGLYRITFGGQWLTTASGNYQISVQKNAGSWQDMIQTSAYYPSMNGACHATANGTTDYFTLVALHDAGGTRQLRWAELTVELVKELP